MGSGDNVKSTEPLYNKIVTLNFTGLGDTEEIESGLMPTSSEEYISMCWSFGSTMNFNLNLEHRKVHPLLINLTTSCVP